MKTLTITQLQAQLANVCQDIYTAGNNILRSLKRAIRSCLWVRAKVGAISPSGIARTVYPLAYDKNNPMSGFNTAAQGWSRKEQDAIRDYYECEDDSYTKAYTARAFALAARVEQEIAMEELHRDALEILVK